MNRLLSWLLGALAGVAALGSLLRKRGETVTRPSNSQQATEQRSALVHDDDRPHVDDHRPTPREFLEALGKRIKKNHTVTIAAALSYYSMLAIFPAVIAAVSIYGLVADPALVERQIADLTDVLPDSTADVIGTQLEAIVDSNDTGLGVATAIGIVGALWSASAGLKALITGINLAYSEPETRSFLVLRGLSLALTLGVILFALTSVTLVTFLPGLLRDLTGAAGWERAVTIFRWPAIFVSVIVGLGLLYKWAPNRPSSRAPLLSYGSFIAAALWLVATVGFSIYANEFGRFNETYGTLTGVVVLLLWFFISGFVILVGAEINDELEERGARPG